MADDVRPGFIGAMGSRRTHEERLERLREAGLTDAELDLLSSPIGLDLGARTPEETAVSIAAEIVARRWGGSGARLAATERPHPPRRLSRPPGPHRPRIGDLRRHSPRVVSDAFGAPICHRSLSPTGLLCLIVAVLLVSRCGAGSARPAQAREDQARVDAAAAPSRAAGRFSVATLNLRKGMRISRSAPRHRPGAGRRRLGDRVPGAALQPPGAAREPAEVVGAPHAQRPHRHRRQPDRLRQGRLGAGEDLGGPPDQDDLAAPDRSDRARPVRRRGASSGTGSTATSSAP